MPSSRSVKKAATSIVILNSFSPIGFANDDFDFVGHTFLSRFVRHPALCGLCWDTIRMGLVHHSRLTVDRQYDECSNHVQYRKDYWYQPSVSPDHLTNQ